MNQDALEPVGPSVAVVVVDVQIDFLDWKRSKIASIEKAFCLPGIQRLLDHARKQGWLVVHVGTRHESTATLPHHQQLRNVGLYCETGSAGEGFVLAPHEGDTVLYKQSYSAFVDSDLDDRLQGVEKIIWAGVASDCCIQQSAFDANLRAFHSLIPIEAVSASSRTAFSASLSSISKSASDVVQLKSVLESSSGEVAGLASPQEIERLAATWFKLQEQLFEAHDPDSISLERAHAILRNALHG